MGKVIIRIDDINHSSCFDEHEKLLDLAIKYSLVFIWGVVPYNTDRDIMTCSRNEDRFISFVKRLSRNNQIIAQHGYRHEITEKGAWRGEFPGTFPLDEAKQIQQGKELLEGISGSTVDVYMPPAHGLNEITLETLKGLKFKTITDGYFFRIVIKNGLTYFPQTVWFPRKLGGVLLGCCLHPDSDRSHSRLRTWIVKHRLSIVNPKLLEAHKISLLDSFISILWRIIVMTKNV